MCGGAKFKASSPYMLENQLLWSADDLSKPSSGGVGMIEGREVKK